MRTKAAQDFGSFVEMLDNRAVFFSFFFCSERQTASDGRGK